MKMEVAKLNLDEIRQQILCHKSGFTHFFKFNVESLHLVPGTCSGYAQNSCRLGLVAAGLLQGIYKSWLLYFIQAHARWFAGFMGDFHVQNVGREMLRTNHRSLTGNKSVFKGAFEFELQFYPILSGNR